MRVNYDELTMAPVELGVEIFWQLRCIYKWI